MCPWTFPDVQWKINPFMDKKNKPDAEKARLEWTMLFESYLQLGIEVKMISPRPGLHDMVFTANAGWGRKGAFILSKFFHQERRNEIKFYKEWFQKNGFEVIKMPNEPDASPYFEGQGDLITTNEGYFFGWGIRSSFEAIEHISQIFSLGKKRITLRLIDPHFYHLDTCLFSWKPLELIMYYPGAFAEEDLQKIRKSSLDKIEVTREEAMNFVCNSVYCDKTAIIGGLNKRLLKIFKDRGFAIFIVKNIKDLPRIFEKHLQFNCKTPVVISLPKPVELLKAGGSYRCCSLFLD